MRTPAEQRQSEHMVGCRRQVFVRLVAPRFLYFAGQGYLFSTSLVVVVLVFCLPTTAVQRVSIAKKDEETWIPGKYTDCLYFSTRYFEVIRFR